MIASETGQASPCGCLLIESYILLLKYVATVSRGVEPSASSGRSDSDRRVFAMEPSRRVEATLVHDPGAVIPTDQLLQEEHQQNNPGQLYQHQQVCIIVII